MALSTSIIAAMVVLVAWFIFFPRKWVKPCCVTSDDSPDGERLWKLKFYQKYNSMRSWIDKIDFLDEEVKKDLQQGVYFKSRKEAECYIEQHINLISDKLLEYIEPSQCLHDFPWRKLQYVKEVSEQTTYCLKPISDGRDSLIRNICIIREVKLK